MNRSICLKGNLVKSLTSVVVLLVMLCASQYVCAQSITFNQTKVTVKVAIENIRKQAKMSVDYADNVVDVKKVITVAKGKNSLTSVMDKIVDGKAVYTINGKHIVVKRPKAKSDQLDQPQTARKATGAKHALSGVVVDGDTDEPLIGVSVKLSSSKTIDVITDIDGHFTLNGVSAKDEVTFSYLGYKPKTILAGDLATITVKMVSDNEQLSEVVVVGAGTQKKVSVTGAITSLKGKEFRAPNSSLTNNLAGKLAGVISSTKSGEPGSSSEFYIRGISTFGGRTAPLILLDGVEISANDLNNLPSQTIESFSILKDASATAIYGARGANGVMLVTTKSGTENTKARINVTVETSMLTPVNVVEFADGATYMTTYNEAIQARVLGANPRYTEEEIANTRNHVNKFVYPDVNWYDLMYKDQTFSQRANVNISGGGSRVTYYMSLQANHDGGIIDTPKAYSLDNNYSRWLYTFQNNIGYKLTETTKIDLRMNAQITNMTSPNTSASDIFNEIYMSNPVSFPALYPEEAGDTNPRFGTAMLSAGRFYTNPLANMMNSFRETNANKLNISLNVNQKLDMITKGLSVTALINFNNYSQSFYTRSLTPSLYVITPGTYSPDDFSQFTSSEVQKGTDYISQSGVTRSSNNTFYFDGRINYDRRFGKHSVTGMLMYMMREYRSDVLPNRNQGFSGRATYDYDNRYLVEFNFGYNGTERLKESRFEFFPAVSLGWVVSGEKFWKPLSNIVDHFKLRTSYGLVGSDETGSSAGAAHFLYLNSVNMGGGPTFGTGYQGSTSMAGPIVTSYAVLDPHWERATEFDFGADFRFFNQVDVTFDYFHNKRDRILMRRASFPAILGYISAIPWSNIGKVDSKGIEFSVNWSKQFTKKFSADLRGTFTYTKNTYEYVDEPDYPYIWQTNTGKSIGHMTGFIAEGLFVDQKDIDTHADQSFFGSVVRPGDIKYRDVNGDGAITDDDRVELSEYGTTPRIQFGLGASFKYDKFDFSVFFTGSAKRRFMLGQIYPFCANSTNDRNLMLWVADNHWSESNPNPNALYPRLGYLDTQIANNTVSSSYWMRNGNFIRFKTLELGYAFKYGRVYLSGDNIAVFSKFKMWDPELSYNSYPLQRTFNLGIQFNL